MSYFKIRRNLSKPTFFRRLNLERNVEIKNLGPNGSNSFFYTTVKKKNTKKVISN
jgi:hypothetical protein